MKFSSEIENIAGEVRRARAQSGSGSCLISHTCKFQVPRCRKIVRRCERLRGFHVSHSTVRCARQLKRRREEEPTRDGHVCPRILRTHRQIKLEPLSTRSDAERCIQTHRYWCSLFIVAGEKKSCSIVFFSWKHISVYFHYNDRVTSC